MTFAWHNAILDAKKNELWVWGRNGHHQLGIENVGDVLIPQKHPFFEKIKSQEYILQFALGQNHTLVLTSGALYACGDNSGPCGFADGPAFITTPKPIPSFISNLPKQIFTGDLHCLALCSDGLYGWGSCSCGQLGIPQSKGSTAILTPTKLPYFDKPEAFRMAALGNHFTLILMSDGLYAMGDNTASSLALPLSHIYWFPEKIPDFDPDDIVKIACSYESSLVLTRSRGLCGFGGNFYHQVSPEHAQSNFNVIVQINLPSPIIDISVGGWHTLALAQDNRTVFTWGYQNAGRLGHSEEIYGRVTFFEKEMPPEAHVLEVQGLRWASAVLTTQGLYCFGYNQYGQAGNGQTSQLDLPSRALVGASRFDDLTFGVSPKVAIQKAETLFALLTSRTLDRTSPFFKDSMPLDIFKLLTQDFMRLGNKVPARTATAAFLLEHKPASQDHQICVSGSCGSLGAWDLARAVPLIRHKPKGSLTQAKEDEIKYSADLDSENLWEVKVVMRGGEHEYKFLVRSAHTMQFVQWVSQQNLVLDL